MGKTKRTVEDVNLAAASNDSKLITQSGLNHFATKFWDKIKNKYDRTFKDASITDDKKLIFTKVSDTDPLEVNLKDYARLTDKNNFKHDVSADDVVTLNNRHIGSQFWTTSRERSLGFRQLTTNSFSDGYVDHIRIYMPNDINSGTNSTWFVWAIKKGANGKDGDTVAEVIHRSKELSVNSITENSTEKKFVKIPINKSFENDTYFIVRCTTHNVEVVSEIKNEYTADVVNMNGAQPPMNKGELINWNSGANVPNNNTVVMHLFGRESIGSLHDKINKLNSDSDLYVKQSEVSTTTSPNKVVRLDDNGKLDKNMLPSIAINSYFPITEFTDNGLRNIVYENGDVVVVSSTGKKYLCINKVEGQANSTTNFIELNSKDGSVVSVNGKSGEVNLELEATADKLKLKIRSGSDTTNIVETSVPIVTDADIDSIIDGLQ